MTAVDKSASDKANPTGEVRARHLIRWYNRGAGGRIQWGKPGDFDQCVKVAAKHMRPDQAKGFCQLRHKDATGEYAGPNAHGGKARKSYDEVPAAIVTTDDEGNQVVVKLAGLRLDVVDGPGLLITYGDKVVALDGTDVPDGATHLTTAAAGTDGGHYDEGGLSIDPRMISGAWGYEVKVEGRRVLWMPAAKAIPEWAKGADLVFVTGGVETPPGFPARRIRPADDVGTSYLLRSAGLARSPARKALLRRLVEVLKGRKVSPQIFPNIEFEAGPDEWKHVSVDITPPAGATSFTPTITVGDVTGAEVALASKALGMKTSAMVALYPPPDAARAMALDGGELPEDLHVTLGFLGSDAVVRLDRDKIEAALVAFAAANGPVNGTVGGLARFHGTDDDGWPLVALIDAPMLTEFRQRLVATLAAAGVEVASNHIFTAHATLAYVKPEDEEAAAAILAEGIEPTPLHFGSIVLAWGDDRTVYTLDGLPQAPPPVMKAVAGPAIKSLDAKRYTMAPLYPASPESPSAAHLDAHGDFATAEDLQQAVWDHVRKGDRTIRDQHRDGTAIGEWVEIVSWPYEVTVPMTKADGTTVQKAFAPGTVFLGVVWNEDAWPSILSGARNGYSLGGVATRVAVEMA